LKDFEPVMGSWWREDAPDVVLSGYLEGIPSPQAGHSWRLFLDGDLGEIPPGYETAVTLFGLTPSGRMTLHHAAPSRWASGGELTERKTMSQWEAFVLLKGDHVPVDRLYREASFSVPQAVDWLGPSRLNAYAHPEPLPKESDGYVHKETAILSGGLELHAGLARSRSVATMGRRVEEEWRGLYSLTSESGFTFQQAADIAYAVAQLQSLALGVPLDSYQLRLTTSGDDSPIDIHVVDPHPPAGQTWRGLSPFFDTSEVDFSSFMSAWLDLCEKVPLVESVVAPRQGREATVEVLLLAQCSALEALASHYWKRPGLSPSDEEILGVLKRGGINSKRRKRVEAQLRQSRWPLEDKLIQAAEMAGEDSSRRLLGNIPDWAHLVMRLRNSLAHGVPLPAGLAEDYEFVIEVQESVAAVLQLAILRHLGYINRLGSKGGELLWSDDDIVASHPYSDFFDTLKWMASRADQWNRWRRRLDSVRDTPIST
jgi:hypothetical protein